LQVARRRQVDAALGLDGLGDDGAGAVADRGPRRLQVGEGDEAHVGEQRAEALPVLGLAGHRQRAEGPAVEALVEGDDLHPARLAAHHRLVAPRELQGGLVGLGARIAEEDLAREGAPGEGLGEADLRLDVIEVRGVVQAAGLFRDGRGQARMTVPEDAHRDARGQVQVAAAVAVFQHAARAARHDERCSAVVVDQQSLPARD